MAHSPNALLWDVRSAADAIGSIFERFRSFRKPGSIRTNRVCIVEWLGKADRATGKELFDWMQ